ncbi:unnamed protein product [Mytilus coruscus]|uniref:DUF6589 domain-containing protein n=1 Tax=Mytilus coruscus TaxID=42192 RepID=A0A6J8C2R7_MYTCO|nr:unnamed protein product [Mytilus coruscus]
MSCANCNKVFIEKPNHSGYYRYSLENSLPSGDEKKEIKKGTQATKWDHIITAIRARQYRRAIKGLYGATKGSKRSLIEITKQIVRKEISELLHSDTGNSFPLFQKVNIPNLETFSWDEALTKLQHSCPLLYNALKGAMTSKQCENSLVKGKYVNLKPKIGTVAALILHAKDPRKASFLPTLFSIQFWRGGLKRELIKQLAHTGICKGYDTTLVAVDNISSDFDSAAVVCKEKIEGQFRNAPVAELRQHEAANPDLRFAMDDTIPYGLGESDSDDGDDQEILEESSDDSNVIPADEDLSLSDEDIAEIDSETEEVKEQKIAHPGFTMCWDNVGKKVTTRNPSEDKKNMYLNMVLGYIGVNRVQTTHLDWEINCELKKAVNLSPGIFVPNAKDTENLENRTKVIVSKIITRHLRWFNRHLGDCTTPHILHEYSKESSERSILINLGVFDVDPSSTQGAITIYENLQRYIPSVREKPYTAIVFGDGLSCERGNDAHRARCNGLNPWERLEGMLNQGRNYSHGELFHYTCVGLDPDYLPNNWFCSDACKNHQDIYPYCTCQQDLGNDEPMIGCSAGSRCTGQEWYHLKCITMTADSLPEGDWFCKAACKKAKKGKPKRKSKSASKTDHSPNSDFKCNYSRAIAWVGLNLLCRRDAVREADGEAMLTYWKFDFIHFFSTKHPKYLILAHRLLISVNGWLPEKLKNDLIYNRTVNYGGGMGRNLPQDFMNEILNRLFKDILDAAKGRYTKTTIQRCGQIVGPLGEALDSVFDSQIIEKELKRHRRRESNRDKNVERMITFLQGDDLFSTINGRHHRAFDPFVHNENPKFPGKFQPKMKQLSKRLDKRRRVIVDA